MWLGWMAHQRESPVAVDDIALERSASDAHNKLLENREYCIIFRALAAHAELTQRLVCEVGLQADRKVLTLRSSTRLINETRVPLEVRGRS